MVYSSCERLALHRLRLFCHILLTANGGNRSGERVETAVALRSRRETAPILTGRLACHLSKGTGEVGLTRKVERKRDIDQRPIAPQESLGAIEALSADVTMR